jgi:predicted RNA binding protein YcfA (HicA-like mRNA interferase family)
MTKLPQISGKVCVKALQKLGFEIDRQRGSHIVLIRDEPYNRIVVPNHKTLKKGMLNDIIKKAGLTVDEFIDLL